MVKRIIGLVTVFVFVAMQCPLPLALAATTETVGSGKSSSIPVSAPSSKKPTVSAETQTATKWNTASEKFLKTATKDVDITAATKELADYTKDLTTAFNETKLFDSSTANKNYLTAALTYVKSAEFSKLTDDQKISYITKVQALGVEVWRGSDTSAEKTARYTQLAEITKAIINEKSSSVMVKTQALDSFAYVFGEIHQDSPKEALKALKTALNVTGGMESVITMLKSNINNSKLTDSQRGQVAVVAEKMISYANYIKTATSYNMSDKVKAELKTAINSFIEKVNDGSVKINSWLMSRMVNWTGMISQNIVNKKENTSGINKKLVDNFVELAHKALLLTDSDSAAVAAKSMAISRLNKLQTSAEKSKDSDLAEDVESTLLDKDFDVKDYISDAKTALSKQLSANTDALIGEAVSKLADVNIENKTGAINSATVKDVLNTVKDWTSKTENVRGVRELNHLTGLFTNAASLLTTAESKKLITSAEKKSYGESLLAAAKTAPDEMVKTPSVKAINEALKDATKQTNSESKDTRPNSTPTKVQEVSAGQTASTHTSDTVLMQMKDSDGEIFYVNLNKDDPLLKGDGLKQGKTSEGKTFYYYESVSNKKDF